MKSVKIVNVYDIFYFRKGNLNEKEMCVPIQRVSNNVTSYYFLFLNFYSDENN